MFGEKITSLILTNLFPSRTSLFSGIFITKILKEYKKLGVGFTAVSLAFKDKGRILNLLRRLLNKPPETPLEEFEGVSFNPIFVERDIFNVVIQKLQRNKVLKVFTDRITEQIVQSSQNIVPFALIECAFSYQLKYCKESL